MQKPSVLEGFLFWEGLEFQVLGANKENVKPNKSASIHYSEAIKIRENLFNPFNPRSVKKFRILTPVPSPKERGDRALKILLT